MTKKQIKEYAKKIVKAEKEDNVEELERITEELSMTDILEIDCYIQENYTT
jgi:hypothetical protein